MKNINKKRAFTLVELLIVIVVIGILFVVVVANVDFTSDTAKEVGVQSTFKSYQVACQTVGAQYSGFTSDVNTLVNYLNKRLDSELQLYTDDSGNIKSFAVDPWGTSIKVEYSEPENSKGQLKFISAGPDTIFYNNDDIITQIKCTIDNDIIIENPVNDSNHTHSFTKEVATSYFKKSDANCDSPALYYYSCSCGQKGTSTFSVGEKDPNVHEIVDDTFTPLANGKHLAKKTCTSCGRIIEEVEQEHDTTEGTICPVCGGPIHTHEFNQQVQTEKHKLCDADCTKPLTYYYSCSCGETGTNTFTVGNPTQHDFSEKTINYKYLDATCSAPAKYFYTCLTCHTVSDQTFDYGVEDETNHVGVEITTYQSLDATQHTKIVKCSGCGGQKSAIDENHNPTVGTCTLCNNHTHSFTQESTDEKFEFKKATCKSKALYFYSCACGEAGSETFEFGETNNNHTGALVNANRADACQIWDCCNKVETTHVYNQQVVADKYIAIEATCTSLPKYYKSCSCGFYLETNETFESGTVDPEAHTKGIIPAATSTVCQKYECCELEVSTTHTMSITGNADAHSTCTVCGYENPTHSYTTTYKTITGISINGKTVKLCNCGYSYNEAKELTNYTWNEIKILADANLTSEQYSDVFGIELGQKKDDTYILVDLDGNAYDGFVFTYYSGEDLQMHYTKENIGGYPSTRFMVRDINNLYNDLSSSNIELYNVIKQVTILCTDGPSNPNALNSYTCHFFLASSAEIGLPLSGYQYKNEGAVFDYLTKANNRKAAFKINTIGADTIWLRTASATNEKQYISYSRSIDMASGSSATFQHYIFPFFVVGSECLHEMINTGTQEVHSTCTMCGYQITSHSYTIDSGIQYTAATCSTARENYAKCSCGYNPQSSSYVVSTGSVVSTAHSWGTWSRISDTQHRRTCNYNGAHTETANCTFTVTIAATCTTTGTKVCNTCSQTATIAAAHTGTATNGGTAGVHSKYSCCGVAISTTHSYINKAQANLCRTCTCGYQDTEHNMSNTGTSGVHQTCSDCGYKTTSHTYTVDSGVPCNYATCSSKQENYLKCSCGYNPQSLSYIITVGDYGDHQMYQYNSDSYQHWEYCIHCDYTENHNSHTVTSWTKTYIGDADWEVSGSCNVCSADVTHVHFVEDDPQCEYEYCNEIVSHDYQLQYSQEGTCIEEAYDFYICSYCGWDDYDYKGYGDHCYEGVEGWDGNCQSESYVYMYCYVCNDGYYEYGDYGDHVYECTHYSGNCAEKSSDYYECMECGYSYTEEGDYGDHVYMVYSSFSGTCVDQAFDYYECCYCDSNYTEYGDYGDHDYVFSYSSDGTCVDLSYDCYECSYCSDYHYEYGDYGSHECYLDEFVPGNCITQGTATQKCHYCDLSIPHEDDINDYSDVHENLIDLDPNTEQCMDCGAIIYH